VARRAGLAKGTIYRHFESKAELYVEILAQNADLFVERMVRVIDPFASRRADPPARFYFDDHTTSSSTFGSSGRSTTRA
jgi:AcrR family transcriptional regulator